MKNPPSQVFLPPTRNYDINKEYRIERERQESVLLPGSKSPHYSVFPASPSPDKLIGSMNPGHDGGLVGRHDPARSQKEVDQWIVSW